MTIQEILKLNVSEVRKQLCVKSGINVKYEDIKKQYDSLQHAVYDTVARPKKTIEDNEGTRVEDVNRVSAPFQELIVEKAVGFLNVGNIKLSSNPETDNEKAVFDMVQKLWSDSKLNYRNKQIARAWMSECEVAELWYLLEDSGFVNWLKKAFNIGNIKYAVRMKILSPSRGDILYPHFDEYGNMDAFGREYTLIEGVDNKTITRFDVYTTDATYKYVNRDGWALDGSPIANPSKKIPVIYYSQLYPEWSKVQNAIERYEQSVSNHGDTNDYFGSPMIVVKGEVEGFAKKGERGKMVKVKGEGNVNYLTWDQSPESVKLEQETLKDIIYTGTQTPDISFKQMQGLGNLSGIALKLMFLDAHLKASNKEETFGEGIQRRLNLLKAFIGNVIATKYAADAENLEIAPVFKYYLPTNTKEDVDTLVSATGGKPVMSQKTAVETNPLVTDATGELQQIADEESASIASQTQVTAGF